MLLGDAHSPPALHQREAEPVNANSTHVVNSHLLLKAMVHPGFHWTHGKRSWRSLTVVHRQPAVLINLINVQISTPTEQVRPTTCAHKSPTAEARPTLHTNHGLSCRSVHHTNSSARAHGHRSTVPETPQNLRLLLSRYVSPWVLHQNTRKFRHSYRSIGHCVRTHMNILPQLGPILQGGHLTSFRTRPSDTQVSTVL